MMTPRWPPQGRSAPRLRQRAFPGSRPGVCAWPTPFARARCLARLGQRGSEHAEPEPNLNGGQRLSAVGWAEEAVNGLGQHRGLRRVVDRPPAPYDRPAEPAQLPETDRGRLTRNRAPGPPSTVTEPPW